jgi:hypothetical protein
MQHSPSQKANIQSAHQQINSQLLIPEVPQLICNSLSLIHSLI